MRYLVFLTFLLVAAHLASAQTKWKPKEPSLAEILTASNATLIFVGTVDSYGRSYTLDGKGDSTEAQYKISKLLKGDLKLSSVTLLFPGHIGFGGGEQIVFATSDRSRVNQLYNLRCPASPCFYTEAGWSLPYSKANESKVMKAIKLKQKSK